MLAVTVLDVTEPLLLPADADRPEVPECVAARDALLHRIAAMSLPANFLDELVHQLGGPGVPLHEP